MAYCEISINPLGLAATCLRRMAEYGAAVRQLAQYEMHDLFGTEEGTRPRN
jgi:hypothetical protein